MTTTNDLRAALGRLRPEERRVLATRWQENSDRLEVDNPALGRMWQAMTGLLLEVDRLEFARSIALADAEQMPGHTMRPAGKGRS